MGSNKFISMVTTMLKIGFIGFGGGTALIPVIEEEIVEKNNVVTEEQFNDEVMIASITPGALPVEIASGIGHQTAGNRGMIAAATAMAFPGSFLTVLFVDSGVVSYKYFYGSIVSVANALPGSILCKILSGCGYSIGYAIHGSVVEGIFVAICGFVCSVAASGSIVIAVRVVYDKFENLRIFAAVKHFIRPIISGLLLNVALSLYLSSILGQASSWPYCSGFVCDGVDYHWI